MLRYLLFLCCLVNTAHAYKIVNNNEICMDIYGFAKFIGMSIIGPKSTIACQDFNITNQIRFKEDPAGYDGIEFFFHGKQSKLGLDFLYKNKILAEGKIEFDFYGLSAPTIPTLVANSYCPRMRFAYVKIGKFLAGQYNSLYMDSDSLPEIIDFNLPAGFCFIRQAQIRLILGGKNNTFQLSIEHPQGEMYNLSGNKAYAYSDQAVVRDFCPDGILGYSFKNKCCIFSIRAVARAFHIKDDMHNIDKKLFGYGVGVSGTFGGDDSLVLFRYQGNFGDGIGRYIQDAAGYAVFLDQAKVISKLPEYFTNSNGESTGEKIEQAKLQTIKSIGGGGGFTFKIHKKVRINAIFGYNYIMHPAIAKKDKFISFEQNASKKTCTKKEENRTFSNAIDSHQMTIHGNVILQTHEKAKIGIEGSMMKRWSTIKSTHVIRIALMFQLDF